MNSYWKNHYDSISKNLNSSLLKQVGKTVNGQEIPQSQIDLILEHIASILKLNTNDIVIDLCCGNGVITKQLAPMVKQIIGVDFASSLIEVAKDVNCSPNIEYLHSDILSLMPQFFAKSKKFLMYEALQHFSFDQMKTFAEKLSGLESGSLLFFGSIPDKNKIRSFYNTEQKYSYFLDRESKGLPHMGKWWTREEIERIASNYGFTANFLSQDSALYTSYYRFDVLFERC